jgi:hypothetical protein
MYVFYVPDNGLVGGQQSAEGLLSAFDGIFATIAGKKQRKYTPR